MMKTEKPDPLTMPDEPTDAQRVFNAITRYVDTLSDRERIHPAAVDGVMAIIKDMSVTLPFTYVQMNNRVGVDAVMMEELRLLPDGSIMCITSAISVMPRKELKDIQNMMNTYIIEDDDE